MKWVVIARHCPDLAPTYWRETLDLAMVAASYGEDVSMLLIAQAAKAHADLTRFEALKSALALYDVTGVYLEARALGSGSGVSGEMVLDSSDVKSLVQGADRVLELN